MLTEKISTCLRKLLSKRPGEKKKITGRVTDKTGATLPGVSVSEEGNKGNGSITNLEGLFEITVADDATIKLSYIGFKTHEELITGDKSFYDVALADNVSELDEVVVVGYGVQKKVTLTGAVSSIKGDEVITTKNENVQNMIAGKISGVRVTQNTSEPGAFNNNFDIRAMGTPLFIIDAFLVQLKISNVWTQMTLIICQY